MSGTFGSGFSTPATSRGLVLRSAGSGGRPRRIGGVAVCGVGVGALAAGGGGAGGGGRRGLLRGNRRRSHRCVHRDFDGILEMIDRSQRRDPEQRQSHADMQQHGQCHG
jgi:hypothetical protein